MIPCAELTLRGAGGGEVELTLRGSGAGAVEVTLREAVAAMPRKKKASFSGFCSWLFVLHQPQLLCPKMAKDKPTNDTSSPVPLYWASS